MRRISEIGLRPGRLKEAFMRRVKHAWKLSFFTFAVLGLLMESAACAYGQVTFITRFVPHSSGRGVWEGSCWTNSIAVARPDAWRCMVGDNVLDPCFASPGKMYAVCEPNPVTGDPGIRLKLTNPLPQANVAPVKSKDNAWLVQLADGTICKPVTGGNWEVQGKWISHYCQSREESQEIDLLGGLNTKNFFWTAEKATVARDRDGWRLLRLQIIGVKRVWQ